jgi:hypothetical protein
MLRAERVLLKLVRDSPQSAPRAQRLRNSRSSMARTPRRGTGAAGAQARSAEHRRLLLLGLLPGSSGRRPGERNLPRVIQVAQLQRLPAVSWPMWSRRPRGVAELEQLNRENAAIVAYPRTPGHGVCETAAQRQQLKCWRLP